MIQQGFYITKEIPERWWVMVFYNIATEEERLQAYGAILATGADRQTAENAAEELKNRNSGFIFSNINDRASVVCIAHATCYDELFNTVTHEINHLTAHICQCYGYETNGEKAAYIQGEIGKNMYKAIAIAICPKCGCGGALPEKKWQHIWFALK